MFIQIITWYMFLFTDGANKDVISWTVKFVIYSQMVPELGFSIGILEYKFQPIRRYSRVHVSSDEVFFQDFEETIHSAEINDTSHETQAIFWKTQ